jgi:hypothetical protein
MSAITNQLMGYIVCRDNDLGEEVAGEYRGARALYGAAFL